MQNKNILKKIPLTNYHILGYVTFFYLIFVFLSSFYYGKIEYGYYQVLRWLVTCFSAWSAVRVYNSSPKSSWVLNFIAIAILFNPIFKITFEKDIWIIIDVCVLLLFIINPIYRKFKSNKK